MPSSLLSDLERYLDAAPRITAEAQNLGPLCLFINRGYWPFYARPRLFFAEPPYARDIETVRRRQRELGLPEAFEWVHETTPGMIEAALAAGLTVRQLPLMLLESFRPAEVPAGITLRLLGPNDPNLRAAQAVAHLGFSWPGTDSGPLGVTERDTRAGLLQSEEITHLQDRIRRGLTRMVTALGSPDTSIGEGPLCVGSHLPLGNTSEIVGLATLPAARHHGLAKAVTTKLVEDASSRGVETIFLTAGSEGVARMYEGLGFARIGTSCVAEPNENAS